jgi:DNA-binding CsgD family transcriptional regulator
LLIGLLAIQACTAVYFLFDALGELMTNPGQTHPLTEAPVALALGIGIVFTAAEVRRTLRRMRDQEAALAAAKGAFAEVVSRQFALWALTPAERDVGLLALKGMEVAEIAQTRGAATGTVRAQLTRIYAKAGVAGRTQFAAFFVEDMLS